jgi:hypothetical protein
LDVEKVRTGFQGETMTISSIGSSLTALSQVSPRPSSAEMAQKMLKDMDTDQNGAVSKGEFVAFGEKIKAQAATAQKSGALQPPKGANAPEMPSADKVFGSMDQNGDQSLSVDELASMLAQGEAQAKAQGQAGGSGTAGGMGGRPPSGGPPPGGGPPGGGKASAGGSSTTSSSTNSSSSTEPADTNKDGVVSAAEKLIYELTHPSTSTASSADGTTSSNAAVASSKS